MDSEAVCAYLLERAKVVGVPGISYGESRQCCMRFSFAADDASLERALENIRQAMEELKERR
jgi:aspartate aminotransferase